MESERNLEIRNVCGHYEVFINGKFAFSADTLSEAAKEIEDARNAE